MISNKLNISRKLYCPKSSCAVSCKPESFLICAAQFEDGRKFGGGDAENGVGSRSELSPFLACVNFSFILRNFSCAVAAAIRISSGSQKLAKYSDDIVSVPKMLISVNVVLRFWVVCQKKMRRFWFVSRKKKIKK